MTKRKPLAVLDIETDPFRRFRSPKPFLAGWFDGKRTRSFWGPDCIAECWRSVRRELKGYVIYWHNGGKFDARYFLEHLHAAGGVVRNIKGRIAQVKLPDGTEFRDSYCILPVALKATGRKLDIDFRKMERGVREQHRAEILDYWKGDLVATFDAVSEFVAQYGMGLTLAGRTFAQLKEKFGIEPPKCSEHHDDLFRRFYYGGRVEFFELGRLKGTFTVIDINSAYPAAMRHSHAFGTSFTVSEKLPRDREFLKRCFVRFEGESAGGLPFRDQEGALSFKPHAGEFFVTGWEFVAAQDAGAVRVARVLSVHEPLEVRDFSAFVEYFYRMKKEAAKGSSEELFAKLFLNSAYGRFALNPREFRDVVLTDLGDEPDENETLRKKLKKEVKRREPKLRGEALRLRLVDYWAAFRDKWTLANQFEDVGISVWEREVPVKSNGFFNVATAASITGCVRAFLFESMRKARRVVYCDTDSIICEHPGDLKLSRELGEWKVEAVSVPDGVWIAGKKLYAMRVAREFWKPLKDGPGGRKRWNEWKTASKGVRLSPAEICRVAEGETVKSTLQAPTFSLFTTKAVKGSKADFVRRTTRRDDLRQKRNFGKKC